MCLEASDGLRSACLTHSLYCGTYPYRYIDRVHVRIYCSQETRLHGGTQEVQHIVILVQDGALNINESMQNRQNTSQTGMIQ